MMLPPSCAAAFSTKRMMRRPCVLGRLGGRRGGGCAAPRKDESRIGGGSMGRLNLTRRAFSKLSAATGAALACASAVATRDLVSQDAGAAARGGEVKRVRTCCRGCGKMECGVWVTVQDGRAVKVEGDQSSFQSSGNCCGKSQSSIQAAYHPDRIYHPMKRTNPKGEDPGWVRISWDEAMQTIGEKFNEIMERYGGAGHLQHVRHVAPVGVRAVLLLQMAVRHAQRASGLGDLQRAAAFDGVGSARWTARHGWLCATGRACTCSGAPRPRTPTTTTAAATSWTR